MSPKERMRFHRRMKKHNAKPVPLKAEITIRASEIAKEHLQFLQAFTSDPPMCEIGKGTSRRCTSLALNFYKRPNGSGVAICYNHDKLLAKDVTVHSPYRNEHRLHSPVYETSRGSNATKKNLSV